MGITEFLVQRITNFISAVGYVGVTVLMALESMIAPVPSEAVMPFAGFLVFEGRMSFFGVIFASTIGSIIGSLISYYAGAWGGRRVVERFGRYLLLDRHHLEQTERFFSRYGDITIFISRFIPVVRHLISIPAGAGHMNVFKFSIYTILGAGMWNSFLTILGFRLKENWHLVKEYGEVVDIIVVLALATVLIWIALQYRRRLRT